jgi:hypothetical protein
LYDTRTRSILQSDQDWPAVSSQTKGLLVNPDSSVDVYFEPKAPAGKENNWVQTIPGKRWNTLLRLYGPLQPWFDKTWRPGRDRTQAVTGQYCLTWVRSIIIPPALPERLDEKEG